MKIAIIGGGHMGSILARSFLDRRLIHSPDLLIVEASAARQEHLRDSCNCLVKMTIDEEVRRFDTIFLCVKPQDAERVCQALRPYLLESHLLVSIMAGTPISSLRAWLGAAPRLVRSMPNLPARCGQAMSVFFASSDLSEEEVRRVRNLLGSFGSSVAVSNEEMVDAATAVSGSGPGYVYYLAEQLIQGAVALGFSQEEATLLVRQTLKGSVEVWCQEALPPAELRAMVTSKGGTTAAAIQSFEQDGIGQKLQAGMKAAFARAKELARR